MIDVMAERVPAQLDELERRIQVAGRHKVAPGRPFFVPPASPGSPRAPAPPCRMPTG